MKNTLQSTENLDWFPGKCFPFIFGGKHFPEVMKNLEMSLFADYIKFGLQTFNCYVYFVLNICFSISSLRI